MRQIHIVKQLEINANTKNATLVEPKQSPSHWEEEFWCLNSRNLPQHAHNFWLKCNMEEQKSVHHTAFNWLSRAI